MDASRYHEPGNPGEFRDPERSGTHGMTMTEARHTDGSWHPAFDASSDGIALTRDGTVVRVNDRFAALHGHDDADAFAGTSWRRWYDDGDVDRLADALSTVDRDGRWEGTATARRTDGSTLGCELALRSGGDGGVVWTARPRPEGSGATETERTAASGNESGTETMTDRQREALEVAYRAGYFHWPRETSAEGVADRLDITRPTLQAHLRKAQQHLLEALFE